MRLRRLRLVPNNIAGRIAGTIVLALLLMFLGYALTMVIEWGSGSLSIEVEAILDLCSAITRLIDDAPAEDRAKLTQSLNSPQLRIEWRHTLPEVNAEPHHEPRLELVRRGLMAKLRDPRQQVIMETYSAPMAGRAADAAGSGAAAAPFVEHTRLSVQLHDQSWLTFEVEREPFSARNILRFLARIAIVAAVVMLLSLWAARRITAPIGRLADAAERLGLDIRGNPVPEEGPRELRMLAQTFNRMQTRLRRFVEDRTRMLAAISHDLRTPLTRLRLRASFIADPEQEQKMLADLTDMEAMVQSALSFARDDAEAEARRIVDLAVLLQTLCDEAVDLGHHASYEGPAHFDLVCRPVAMRRALTNLVDNAVKYGAAARARLLAADQHATIEIVDEGPGIAPAELEKVFAPFYRLEGSRNRDTGGVGLGLSVARSIIHGHGGEIALANRAVGGLQVTVTLPAGAAANDDPWPVPAGARPGKM